MALYLAGDFSNIEGNKTKTGQAFLLAVGVSGLQSI